jgi:hypothetical protein
MEFQNADESFHDLVARPENPGWRLLEERADAPGVTVGLQQ